MRGVQTARGAVGAASLGQVLMHEHDFVLTAEVQLREHGVPQSGIDLMPTANPARILAG